MGIKYVLIPALSFFLVHANAQDLKDKKGEAPGKTQDAANGDRKPEPGYDLNIYVGQNLRYPDSARLKNIQGRVFLSFCVNENGSISDCSIVKRLGYGCDEEALRVIKNMPNWKPGINKGKPAKVALTLPIVFKLEDDATGAKKGTEKKIYSYVEQMPAPGYDYGSYLGQNIHYPDTARAHNIQGKILVKFCVNEDGSISDCKVLHGIDPECDEEALRVVKNMPSWKPGKQNGKPVKVWFTLPINFKLED